MKKKSFIMVYEDWIKLVGEKIISYPELLLLCKIDSLANNVENTQKACYASNACLANILQVDVRTIQRYLKKFKEIGFVKIFENREGYNLTKQRYIYVQHNIIDGTLEKCRKDGICDTSDIDGGHECREETTMVPQRRDTDVTLIKEDKTEKENKIKFVDVNESSDTNNMKQIIVPYDDQKKIVNLFETGKKYGKKHPEIEMAMGNKYTGKEIYDVISKYVNNGNKLENIVQKIYDIPLADKSGVCMDVTRDDFERMNPNMETYTKEEATCLAESFGWDVEFTVNWFAQVYKKKNEEMESK